MATKRQCRANGESCERLRAHFIELSRNPRGAYGHWTQTWERIITDRWFQREVESCARRVVANHHLWNGLVDDVTQEVILLLADKLAHEPDLHASAPLLANDFEAWMGTIIYHACCEALRRMGETRAPHAVLADCEASGGDWRDSDLRQDMADAIAHLEGREQQVAVLRLTHRTHAMIAEDLGITERQVEYALELAGQRLRRLLSDYDTADH